MATIRLVPSTYYLSNTQYLSVTNANNMYHNTDSTTYATVYNSRTQTSSYYIYLRGFNFDDVPDAAIVSSFTVKLKAYESGVSTSSSYQPYLANGTTAINGSCSAITTTTSVHTFTGISADWETIKEYGNNFGIRINCRRASRNTAAYMYIYGAEIEVEYTVPDPRTVTTTLVGNGTIDPSGTQTMYDGDEYNLTIVPTDESDDVVATKDGDDITLIKHTGGASTESNVLGEYSFISGGFNSGESWFEGRVGHGYDTDNTTTSNYYSSSSSTRAVFQYDVSFHDIPDGATITSLYMMVNGHAESTSNNNEYMCVQLMSGDVELSEQLNFKSIGTSNSTQTVNATTIPTVAQLENLVIECTLGYYGGAINGATVFLEYEVSGVYYTYSTTINGDMTVVVTIGSQTKIYIKENGVWVEYSKIYKKIDGVWVEQSSDIWSTLFNTTINYIHG